MEPPSPQPRGARGRIPPFPPTAVGLIDGPEFGPDGLSLPRLTWWRRLRVLALRVVRR